MTRSCDTGQRIPCFDSCQLTIIWMSVIKLSTGYMLPHYRESLTFHIDCPMCGRMDGHVLIKISRMGRLTKFLRGVFTWENSHRREFHTGMTGSIHISLFEGTFHVDKIHVRFKITNITHALPVPVYWPISHRNVRSFRVYMIPLWDFVPEWNSRPGKQPGWTHDGTTRAGMTFCGGII